MATSFKKTTIKSGRVLSDKINPDETYWNNFQNTTIVKGFGAINHIEFCPQEPYNFSVCNSMKIELYDGSDCSQLATMGRFQGIVHSCNFRNDGLLLVAGTEDKYIKLFKTGTRSLLRTFLGHWGAVHVTKFLDDGFRVMSGSDDNSVRVWDIPTETNTVKYWEHKDYVRAGVASKASPDIFLTGSYDHTVKLWDGRTKQSVLTVDHGFPVESLLMFPSGGIFMSAGGNYVKVWDSMAGGKLLATLNNHHKTVTSLCFSTNYERFMSASLDQLVKVYDVGTYQVVHTLRYPGPILSHAVSPDDKVLAVGMTDRMLSLRKRVEEDKFAAVKTKIKKKDYMRYGKERSYQPGKSDQVVELKKREILAKYDRHLKAFEHTKALDEALKLRTSTPEVIVSVMQELIRRGSIRQALAGRNETGIRIVLKFISRNIHKPLLAATLIDVLNLMLDLYATSEMLDSEHCKSLFLVIRHKVNQESKFMTGAQEVMGSLNLLFNVAENALLPPVHNPSDHTAMDAPVDVLTNGMGLSNGLEMDGVAEECASPRGRRRGQKRQQPAGDDRNSSSNNDDDNVSLLAAIGSLVQAAQS